MISLLNKDDKNIFIAHLTYQLLKYLIKLVHIIDNSLLLRPNC